MDDITELLTRGVDRVYPSKEELEKVLRSNKKLKLYQGFDPTGTRLHIGHMVGLRKLAQFQKLGHRVIFVIGDGTGQAGDPSGKTTASGKFLTRDELRTNAVGYVKQASKILRFEGENPVEIRYNGDWLNKLTLPEILKIIGHFSAQQLVERDLFQQRIKNNVDINLREFFYPILQAYDSVAMEVDLELGGTDQIFNMLFGRKLVKEMLKKDKFVMTTPLLEDSQGRKIGKTEGNVIALNDEPVELFAKIMALGDDVILKGLEYLTDVSMEEIQRIDASLQNGENPINYKKRLAYEVAKELNTETDAKKAQDIFEGKAEEIVPVVNVSANSLASVAGTIIETGLLSSMSEAKRKFEEKAIKIDGAVPESLKTKVESGSIISVGRNKVKVSKK